MYRRGDVGNLAGEEPTVAPESHVSRVETCWRSQVTGGRKIDARTFDEAERADGQPIFRQWLRLEGKLPDQQLEEQWHVETILQFQDDLVLQQQRASFNIVEIQATQGQRPNVFVQC